MHRFTIHTMRPADAGHGEQLSSRFVAADNVQAALAALDRPAHPEAALREGERPIGWSPDASKSFGGSKRHTQLWEEAKAAGRLVYETAGPEQWQPWIAGMTVHGLLQLLQPNSSAIATSVLTATEVERLRFTANTIVGRLALELQSGGLDPYGATDRALQLLGYTPVDDNVVDAEVKPGPAMTPAAADALLVAAVASVSTPTPEAAKASATQEQTEHTAMLARDAAGAEYSSWVIEAKPRAAAAKPAWHSLSPDLQPSSHQVAAPHGSALLLGE